MIFLFVFVAFAGSTHMLYVVSLDVQATRTGTHGGNLQVSCFSAAASAVACLLTHTVIPTQRSFPTLKSPYGSVLLSQRLLFL